LSITCIVCAIVSVDTTVVMVPLVPNIVFLQLTRPVAGAVVAPDKETF
jgi:hypothetical protein